MEYSEDLEFISKKTKLKTIEYIFNPLPETTSEKIKEILHYELMYTISKLNSKCYVDKSFLAYIVIFFFFIIINITILRLVISLILLIRI
jgi:hypothetical protein